jgi:fatty acid kinase fatty acid binding subunit
MIKIVTDSTADIPPDLGADITIAPCFIQFETASYLDGVDITREQFYARLAGSNVMPKTAAPSAGIFEETYRRVAGEGDEVVSLHVAGALSGMVNSARLGAEAVSPTRITVYDSESVTMGLGWMCVAAARAARQGKSVAQVIALLDEMKTRTHVFAALDTFEFLRRSGRVGWASSMVGQLLNVKPLVGVYRGVVRLVDRVRTRARSIQRLVELAAGLGKLESLAVLHTTAQEAALQLAHQVAHLAPAPIPVVEVTPVIGTHVGPNGLGLAAIVKHGE